MYTNNGAADLIHFSGKKHLPTRFITCGIKCYILPTVLLGPMHMIIGLVGVIMLQFNQQYF